MMAGALWACFTHRVARNPAFHHVAVTAPLVLIAIYRLVVMRFQTTTLLSTAPGSLNTPASKTVFYLLHVLPEWIAMVMLLSVNVREVYGTGKKGDPNFWEKKNGGRGWFSCLRLKGKA